MLIQKKKKALAQSKLKDIISQLNRELQHLEVLENRGMISDADKEKKQSQQKYRSQKRQKLQQMEKQLKEAGFDMQLVRPTSQNLARRSHDDTHFCAALIRNIKEILSLLGPKSALVISQDNKARIPLSLA
ncbi:4622_t:CDS:2 [Dentiscutata erythropus]|uniref:4622_t:CDS:1 n=1 Tax=Dentiscutata erythropus TaxID=1348616 RepID=A0A9N8VVB7_9GLOM|nr:4622_t:CDS:2 [Dentiscutata erythropus]